MSLTELVGLFAVYLFSVVLKDDGLMVGALAAVILEAWLEAVDLTTKLDPVGAGEPDGMMVLTINDCKRVRRGCALS